MGVIMENWNEHVIRLVAGLFFVGLTFLAVMALLGIILLCAHYPWIGFPIITLGLAYLIGLFVEVF